MDKNLFNFIVFLIALLSIFIGYLFGSINFGKIIAKIKGIDLLNLGSKNPGATNLARVSKLIYGIITAFADLFKVFLAGWIFWLIFVGIYHKMPANDSLKYIGTVLIYFTPTVAVIAHCFPVYSKFQNGGKGVASFAGLCFFVSPWFGIIFMVLWWSIQLTTKYVSLASLFSSLLTTLLFWIRPLQYYYWLNEARPLFLNSDSIGLDSMWIVVFLFMAAISFLIVYRHKENIKRLICKQESKFYFRRSKK